MLQLGSIWVDLKDGVVERAGAAQTLTDKEASLLRYLADRPGQVVCRAQLNEDVWGYHPDSASRAIDKTLARLRAKIEEDTARPRFLQTVRGEGWRLVMTAEEAPELPAPRGALFGRKATIEQLSRWWEQGGRWVTLVGIGGLGKTRLALEVARKVAVQVRVLWIDLTDVGTEAGLLGTTARALGLKASETDRVSFALAQQVDLLVLDNLEDLAGVAGAVIGGWVSAAPTLRILGTSRIRLQGAGEHTLLLPPLSEADGAAMLMSRLGWPESAAEDAAAISRRLDGIPLAIELITAAAGPLSPAMLAARVDSILDRASLSGAPSRHATISVAIRSNLSRLSEVGRQALASLAILPGAFTLPLGEVVVGGEDPLSALMALMDHSFIHPDGERLRLLVPIREAVGRGSDAAGALDRLVAHLARRCRELEDQPTPFHRWFMGVGRPTLQVALQHAVSTRDADALALCRALDLSNSDSTRVRVEALQSVLDAVEGPEPERLRVEMLLASRLIYSTDLAAGEARFAVICARLAELGLADLEARAWVLRAARGTTESRLEAVRRALVLTDDPGVVTKAWINQGFAFRTLRQMREARAAFFEARQRAQDLMDHNLVLLGLGGTCSSGAEAREWLAEAEEVEILPRYRPSFMLLRGYIHVTLGEVPPAMSFLHEARRAFLRVGDQHNLLHTLWNITLCQFIRGDLPQARRYHARCEALSAKISSPLALFIQIGHIFLLGWTRRFSEMAALAAELRGEDPSFWGAVADGLAGDTAAMAADGSLSEAQQSAVAAVARGEAMAPADRDAVVAALDFGIDPHFLLRLLDDLSEPMR